jgi:hypothetical protein
MARRDPRVDRDVHALDANGMVACNPRDPEAEHRADVVGLVTGARVKCAKCLAALAKTR